MPFYTQRKKTQLSSRPYVAYRSYADFRKPQIPEARKKRRGLHKFAFAVVLLVVIISLGAYAWAYKSRLTTSNQEAVESASEPESSSESKTDINHCQSNKLSKLILVSINEQHLWACTGATIAYDSAVVTGMEKYPADQTPPGTYQVYAKQTNQDLKGCDTTGCWDDPVSYWMPWLSNKYGIYGFHDATWRNPSQFGHVSIYAPDTAAVVGSHGCVELPLATAKWLYDWTPVGTTVKIVS